MGNNDTGAIRFRQDTDFPMMVSLGREAPSWGLYRGKQGLRFLPTEEERFAVRGDRRRLWYKGREKSHRFTIRGDTAFEYDCILEREPKTNVISFLIEGVEGYDFFRQPDRGRDPFLRGSYAVYRNETFIGEGTGKLCHIHRPLVIDAGGRRVWGDLSIAGNRLYITIPETWLCSAKYPVVIDPTVGTSTVGSQTMFYDTDNEETRELFVELGIIVNRFSIPQTFNGSATAYFYAYNKQYEDRCQPVLYSDNGNKPLTRRSKLEGEFDVAVGTGKAAGWRNTTFQTNTSLAAGTYIWYGLFCDYIAVRFDYGLKCFIDAWDTYGGTDIPNSYPLLSANSYYNFKVSMYFSYTLAQNYTRTLTQGVRLSDGLNNKMGFIRKTVMNGHNTTAVNRGAGFGRKCLEDLRNAAVTVRNQGFGRKCIIHGNTLDGHTKSIGLLRKPAAAAGASTAWKRVIGYGRAAKNTVKGGDHISGMRVIFRAALDTLGLSGGISFYRGFLRKAVDGLFPAGTPGSGVDYVRGFLFHAGVFGTPGHGGIITAKMRIRLVSVITRSAI
jgi:hypothetical protein